MTDAPDLDAAIVQQINLGVKVPQEILDRIKGLYGESWLREQAASRADEVALQRARELQRGRARAHENAIAIGNGRAQVDALGDWVALPDGYKRRAEMTADDWRAKAAWYEEYARSNMRRAAWCYEVADLMDAHGAATTAELTVDLPPLPDEEPVAA